MYFSPSSPTLNFMISLSKNPQTQTERHQKGHLFHGYTYEKRENKTKQKCCG